MLTDTKEILFNWLIMDSFLEVEVVLVTDLTRTVDPLFPDTVPSSLSHPEPPLNFLSGVVCNLPDCDDDES